MGVAVGDYDNDGFPDLLRHRITADSILYHNNGDGTFTDVTAKAGVAAPGWTTSAVWFDYDNDGQLDLFVCRFVDFDKTKNTFCGDNEEWSNATTAFPNVYKPTRAGCFTTTATARSRTCQQRIRDRNGHSAKAWGVVATDINNDGWMDLFVANDTVAKLPLRQSRQGTIREKSA